MGRHFNVIKYSIIYVPITTQKSKSSPTDRIEATLNENTFKASLKDVRNNNTSKRSCVTSDVLVKNKEQRL